jgi:hypothetical protein
MERRWGGRLSGDLAMWRRGDVMYRCDDVAMCLSMWRCNVAM